MRGGPLSTQAITPAWRGTGWLERRVTVAGEEDEEFSEPKAFSAALRMIFSMGSALESAFVSKMIPMPSSRAAPMTVDTPGASPVCQMVCWRSIIIVTYWFFFLTALTHIMAYQSYSEPSQSIYQG